MSKEDFHVVKRFSGWAVRKEGSLRASSLHTTQREAINKAKSVAKDSCSRVVIHRADGTVRDINRYGADPYTSKS